MPRKKKPIGEPRKTRSDAGNIILNERDIRILEWIIEQRAIRFDQMQRLLTICSEEEPLHGDLLGYTTVMGKINKWKKADCIEYERTLAKGPGWIYPTRKGLKMVGYKGIYSPQKPDWTALKHIYAVNQVRLLVNPEYWRNERQIRADRETGSEKAIPDGLMWLTDDDEENENDAIAIEVQLSPLKVDKWNEKLEKLVHIFDGYRRVHFYVPNEKIARAAVRARQKLSYSDQNKIEIFILPLTL